MIGAPFRAKFGHGRALVRPPCPAPSRRRRKRPPRAARAPAAPGDAAAASFAALTVKLDYLDAADIRRVRDAYRFADEAHLGQFRASGEPYITHPIAVAGLCAEWKLDAQAIMAALMHDAMEDCGISKAELIERFGAPTADLVDGLTKLDKLRFSTREESQAESFRKMLLAMTRDVRVILVKLADRLHNMRTMDAVAAAKRTRIAARDARDLRADRPPARPQPDLPRAAGALVQAPEALARGGALEGGAEGARLPARHRRADPDATSRRRSPPPSCKAQIFGREKTLYSIYAKMREKHLSFAQVNDIFGFRIVVGTLPECYMALGVLHQLIEAGAGPLQGLHRDPEGQRLPVAAHDAGQPARHRGRVPDPHRADARRRREGHRRALALQGARRRPGARPRGAAPGRALAAVADRHPGRDARRRRVPRARQDRPLPRRGLRLHAEVEDPRPAARRDAGRLRLRDPHRRRRPLRRRQRQRRAGAAARRAEERRRRRDHRRAERAAEPGLAQFRAHRPRALQDPALPEEHGAGGVARPRREDAGAGAARRGPGAAARRRRRRGGLAAADCAGAATRAARISSSTSASAARSRPSSRRGWRACWPKAACAPTR